MKKLMFVAAAIVAGVAVADVSSANIVGYITFNTAAAVNDLHGAPFANIGGEAIPLQSITLSSGTNGKDIIQVFDPVLRKYTNYMWWSDVKVGGVKSGKPGWGDNKMNATDVAIDPGQGFWLKTSKANTVTVSGQVVAASDNTIETAAAVNDLTCGIYPMALDIQKITLSAGTNGKDIIQVFDPTLRKYTNYMWWSDIKVGGVKSGKPGWGDNKMNAVTLTLDPGQAFWLKTSKANTVTFEAPAGL